MLRISLCLLIYLIFVNIAKSQSLSFERIKVEDGLPHSTINDLIQDSLGFIWMATNDGLSRYDNHEFKNYNKSFKNGRGVSNNRILSMYIDNKNRLWVGTANSIELYDKYKDSFRSFTIINPGDNYKVPVSVFFQNTDTTFLLGTDGGGVIHFNTRTFETETAIGENLLSDFGKRVSSICKDKFSRYWVTTADSGWFVLNQSLTRIVYSSKKYWQKEKQPVYSKVICLDNERMLIASYGDGIAEVNIMDFETKEFKYFHNKNKFTNQVFDINLSKNKLYVGTDGDGLYVLDLYANSLNHYAHSGFNLNSIGGDVVRRIFIDKEENIWLTHYQAGLSVCKKKKEFRNLPFVPNDSNSLCYSNVASVLVQDSFIWVGTDGGGINIFDKRRVYSGTNGQLEGFIRCNFTLPQKVICLFKDSKGFIWVGTYLEGAYVYNTKTKILYNVEDYFDIQLNNHDVRCFYEDSSGDIWLGTHGGGVNIIDIEKGQIQYLKRDTTDYANSLSLDWVRKIIEDSYGFVWIATTYGLNMYDPVKKEFRQFFYKEDDSTSLSNSFVYTLFEDNKKNLWVGTRSGLCKYNRGNNNFTRYTVEDGLSDNLVVAICQDNMSNLWFSTNNGLTKMQPDGSMINYDVNDGLISNTFVGGVGYSNRKDEIYLGSINGLTHFKPQEIIDKYPPIKVVFTNFQIQNKKVIPDQEINGRIVLENQFAYTNKLVLFKEENVLSFEFSALTSAFDDKVRFKYKLEGFDREWILLEKGNSVTYTNLKKGNYTLKVKVGNMGKGQPIAKMEIKILPPYYETIWFRILVLMAFVAISALFIKSRIDKIKQEKILLQEKYEIDRIKTEQDKIAMEKLMLENEVKQKELDMGLKNSQLISTTLQITTKNEIMNQVKSEILSFSNSIISNEVKEGVEKLLEKIDEGFKVEDDWGRFEEHFDQVHIDFFKRVKGKYPGLSLSYLKLIAYLRLDLSSKEIASLMGISTRGVEKSRSRLRKKLDLEPGANLSKVVAQI